MAEKTTNRYTYNRINERIFEKYQVKVKKCKKRIVRKKEKSKRIKR